MFKRHRKNHPANLTKIDYWKKWNLFELFDNLNEAARFLAGNKANNASAEFISFRKVFIEELGEIKGDNVADFTLIWTWFTPGNEWDSIVGLTGRELGNTVFQKVDKWKRNQGFLPHTKVSLDDEFGVVLDIVNENDVPGRIRWDTNEENDIEDWRGLFGAFLDSGGQIINQDHKFKFINDDGSLILTTNL